MVDTLQQALDSVNAADFSRTVVDEYLKRKITTGELFDSSTSQVSRIPRLGIAYESLAVGSYEAWVAEGGSQSGRSDEGKPVEGGGPPYANVRAHAEKAFYFWRALSNLGIESDSFSGLGLDALREELPDQSLSAADLLALHFAVAGALALKPAEVRQELKKWQPSSTTPMESWESTVLRTVCQALILLCRKQNGWQDVDWAMERIAQLRSMQSKLEEEYLNKEEGEAKQVAAALRLVGLYHLAQMVSLSAEFLSSGRPGSTALRARLDTHLDRAKGAFDASNEGNLSYKAQLIWILCRELVQNSIWTSGETLPPRLRDFLRLLSSRARTEPILELWPSQQEALWKNLLTTFHRAVLVEMPTSAGKTLLAKFVMVQSRALVPNATIVYVVPTRALVNQVTFDLRQDFDGMDPPLRVEMTIPAFELDPTEDTLLSSRPDVLVVTPEKLDLLVRKKHASVENVSLIVADEAHNIGSGARGARLELLLGMLKRDRPNTRFLLLSPFLPNDADLLAWLGNGSALPPIAVTFRPGNRVVGGLLAEGQRDERRLIFETLPAVNNTDISAGLRITLGMGKDVPKGTSIKALTRATAHALRRRGAVLVLCNGKKPAEERAREIAEDLGPIPASAEVDAVIAYLEAEAGQPIPLLDFLRKGVAYHHAGLSHESRWLIEVLIKHNLVKVVCGTLTLAQGINFPISSVIVETFRKGREEELSYEDFWNIAGRAGRTLMDSVGLVGFPIPDEKHREKVTDFLREEADLVASQLAVLVDKAEQLSTRFDTRSIWENPELSTLLQFLAHAMRVAGRTNISDEVEDIMRSSLVYHQLRAKNPEGVKRLLGLCRAYLVDLGRRPNVFGLLGQADVTGFSTPSVLRVLAQVRTEYPDLNRAETWLPETLFDPASDALTRRVAVVGQIPEIHLGQGRGGEFNPALVSAILKDWVAGKSIVELARVHALRPEGDEEPDLVKFEDYLFTLLGKASWGFGALEGVCLSSAEGTKVSDVGYVPSMIFFGVKSKEAVWLRMGGVPRILAGDLANLWRKEMGNPTSYEQIRSWIGALSDDRWRSVIPQNSRLTPEHCRFIWKTLGMGI